VSQPLLKSQVPGHTCRSGKVRDVYDLGDWLVIVATDRISAFDWILPTPIPGKGKILTAISLFWFDFLGIPNHLISADLNDFPREFQREELAGRSMLVKKTTVVPMECVVRGYLVGSGWKDYQSSGEVCGVKLPAGMQLAQAFPEPIFTPATKAESGHDENISFVEMAQSIGQETAYELKAKSLDVYQRAAAYALERGIIIADTKFEWGRLPTGEIILIDEVLTPDSSRFWPKDQYRVGSNPPSYDKQFVRDWLESTTWDKNSPPPELPPEVISKSREKYLEAQTKLTSPC
jgi:phosphoribosylaminoimidazole-succinocarboxamide synthase